MKQAIGRLGAMGLIVAGAAMISGGLMGAEKAEKKAKPPEEGGSLMRKKLKHAQGIMEGLALEDFDMIKREGADLLVISSMDEWMKYDVPAYKQLSEDFRQSVDRMAAAAEAKNLDGATIGFMQATMSCVECHKLIRSGKLATGIQ